MPGYHVTADDEQKIVLTGGIGVPKLAEPKVEAAPGSGPRDDGDAGPEPVIEFVRRRVSER